jgi:hypothetical protein
MKKKTLHEVIRSARGTLALTGLGGSNMLEYQGQAAYLEIKAVASNARALSIYKKSRLDYDVDITNIAYEE